MAELLIGFLGAGAAAPAAAAGFGAASATVGGMAATAAASSFWAAPLVAGLTAGELLSGAFSGLSALSSFAEGQSQAAAARFNAENASQSAKAQITQGIQKENQIRRRFLDTAASQRAAYAASGVAPQGSPTDVYFKGQGDARADIGVVRTDAQLASLSRRIQSRQLLLEGESATTGGMLGAFQALAGFGVRQIEGG